jgi:hypothetical protein
MACYEVVLRYPDRDELRFTDRPLPTDRLVEIAGQTWSVTLEREPADIAATERFLCELMTPQRGSAQGMQALHRVMRERMSAAQDGIDRQRS